MGGKHKVWIDVPGGVRVLDLRVSVLCRRWRSEGRPRRRGRRSYVDERASESVPYRAPILEAATLVASDQPIEAAFSLPADAPPSSARTDADGTFEQVTWTIELEGRFEGSPRAETLEGGTYPVEAVTPRARS